MSNSVHSILWLSTTAANELFPSTAAETRILLDYVFNATTNFMNFKKARDEFIYNIQIRT
jgi:hypothetical protein